MNTLERRNYLLVGDHVSLLDIDSTTYEPLGVVAGFATSSAEPGVVVTLDEPFWAEGRSFYITSLVVHPTNLRVTLKSCEE